MIELSWYSTEQFRNFLCIYCFDDGAMFIHCTCSKKLLKNNSDTLLTLEHQRENETAEKLGCECSCFLGVGLYICCKLHKNVQKSCRKWELICLKSYLCSQWITYVDKEGWIPTWPRYVVMLGISRARTSWSHDWLVMIWQPSPKLGFKMVAHPCTTVVTIVDLA